MKKEKRSVAFTGTRSITASDEVTIASRLRQVCEHADRIITGACQGVDSYIAQFVDEHFPHVRNIIVVPARRDLVCEAAMKIDNAMYIYMPLGSSYRNRNETLVDIADEVEAFWSGDKRSGTYMTINIAKRRKKLGMVTELKR